MGGDQGHGDGEGRKVRRGKGESGGSPSLANLVSGSGRNPSQMIICYDGSVCVFNCMTAEKVQAIVLMAAAAEAAAAVPEFTRTPSLESSTAEANVARPSPPPKSQQQQSLLATDASNLLCRLQEELPVARRNSLQRFLQKRRERLVSKAPYLATKMLENPSDGCSGNEHSTPPSSFKELDMSP